MNKLINGLSDLVGRAAAAFHQQLENANAQAREQARLNAAANFCANWLNVFLWLLWEAIKATADLTGLVVPHFPDGLVVVHPVRVSKDGVPCIVASAWAKPGYAVPTKQIQAQLNAELSRLCALHGIPKIVVVAVRRYGNGRVMFGLAFAADVQAAKEAARAAQVEKDRNGPITI